MEPEGPWPFSPDETALFSRLSRALSPRQPLKLRIVPKGQARFCIVVVSYDYFSAFALICGLFSAFGLNIESGNVQTLFHGSGRHKIVDVFRVHCLPGFCFDPPVRQTFEHALQELIGLLERGAFRAARAAVNQRLVARLERIAEALPDAHQGLNGLLAPLRITFDNARSRQWTRLKIRGKDSPAFLYAFSSALAMREINIHGLKIARRGEEIDNQLDISSRRGKKIKDKKLQMALRISAGLTKQFVHDLRAAPNPSMAMVHFDQFLDKILETPRSRPFLSFLRKQKTLRFLTRFFGTSHFLWEDFLRLQFDAFFPILERSKAKPLSITKRAMQARLGRRLRSARGFEEKRQVVNHFKDEELFRIDLRHLCGGPVQLQAFSRTLGDLAGLMLSETLKICRSRLEARCGRPLRPDGKTSAFTILGLGKLGGRELGYASDIELLFVYEQDGASDGPEAIPNRAYFEKLAQSVCHFIETRQEGIFKIDTRLRPYGKSGPIAIPFPRFKTYYHSEGPAMPFERQALIRLRFSAGSRALGRRCEQVRDQFVYSGAPWDLKGAFALRVRQTRELVPPGRTHVKYSPGGLVDLEYFVQYLQIIHGKETPEIRTTNTLEGLAALSAVGRIDKKSASQMEKACLFLRALVDALRMVRGRAKDLILPPHDSEAFVFLSRRMGFERKNWRQGSLALEAAIREHMETARRSYWEVLPAILGVAPPPR